MKVEVLKLSDKGKPEPFKEIEVQAKKVGKAKREARVALEAAGLVVRAISPKADGGGGLIAYVTEQRPDARERGKPVVQTGLVGKGRQIRRRSTRR